jgi:UDP-N-acetylglucosamine 2-epimerase (non-hydrolysing)
MVHFIVGTRAQLIKIAPVMKEFERAGAPYNFIFIAQHKETMTEMLDDFGLKQPDYTVGNIGSDISHPLLMARWLGTLIGQITTAGKAAFRGDRTGIAVVHGDALPALVGALWAKMNGLRVAHVEAGLRSFNYLNPFPEELIRVLLWKFKLADLCFCPNDWAVNNLSQYSMIKVDTHHNTLLDSLRIATAATPSGRSGDSGLPKEYGVVSLHRTETLMSKSGLESAIVAVENIAEKIPLVFVLHPSTRKTLESQRLLARLKENPNLRIYPRLNYFAFMELLKNSQFLISDGGSNQEECYYLGHPCLLLRATTERVEGLGENALISNFDERLVSEFVENYRNYRRPPVHLPESPSEIIFEHLRKYIS